MIKHVLAAALGCAVLAAVLAAPASAAAQEQFAARLNGFEETATLNSPASGQFTVQLSADAPPSGTSSATAASRPK